MHLLFKQCRSSDSKDLIDQKPAWCICFLHKASILHRRKLDCLFAALRHAAAATHTCKNVGQDMEKQSQQTLKRMCTHLEKVALKPCYPLFQLAAVCRHRRIICSLLEQGARLCLRRAQFGTSQCVAANNTLPFVKWYRIESTASWPQTFAQRVQCRESSSLQPTDSSCLAGRLAARAEMPIFLDSCLMGQQPANSDTMLQSLWTRLRIPSPIPQRLCWL